MVTQSTAVVPQVTVQVPFLGFSPAGLQPLVRDALLLLHTPPNCEQCVWNVVTLAALSASECGCFALQAASCRYV